MRRQVSLLVVALLLLGAPAIAAPTGAAAPAGACADGPVPFAGLATAHLTRKEYVSKDATPVRYVRWSGVAPSFDGMPLSVDVTVPCGTTKPAPTVVMAHGFTDDKTVWEETGKSDTVLSKDRASNNRWNNIWFASRGYAVLNFTARGWRDSCGPDTPGRTASAPAPQCAPYQYWIHLDDKRWEVRDLQWLTGALVQSGVADAKHLAVTGGSYGGAPTAMAALLGHRVVCGAVAELPSLGADPCAGKANGALVPWTTPDGKTRLDWVAALPLYTYADLLEVLAPNGRGSDAWSGAPPDASHTDPFGVPLKSTISGLLLAAGAYGSLAPPGADPTSDITTSTHRLLAGNPFPASDPQVVSGVREYREFKSPITVDVTDSVPMFWVQGLTDALFPGLQALQMLNHVRAANPHYPFKLFLGDIGHDYAAERPDEWDLVKAQMNAFIDHYLRPDRTPAAPAFDVTSTVTRCLQHNAPMQSVVAPTWDAIHPTQVTFSSSTSGSTSTGAQGPAAVATDPISTATLSGPNSYKGCRIMRPSQADPTAVTYLFPVQSDLLLMGGPVIDLQYTATASDAPLSVRVWDVAPDDSVQGLVTRGTYRAGTNSADQEARFQIAPQGYRFVSGHTLKVEVSADDSPYFQASNVAATVTVTHLAITLPLGRADAVRSGDGPEPNSSSGNATPRSSGLGDAAPWLVVIAGLALVLMALVTLRGRRRRQS